MKYSTFALITLSASTSAFSPIKSGTKTVQTQATSTASASPDLAGSSKQAIFDPLGLYSEDSPERQSGLIKALESPMEMDQTVIDPLALYQDQSQLTKDVIMSPSLPFLKRPEILDGSLPGDRGFDPLNFSSDASALTWYREAEVKHARLAMLAAVGWPLAEITHKFLAETFDADSILAVQDKVPSVLNGGLASVDPLFWVGAISAAAALEFIATKNGEDRAPGDFGFDPLSLGGSNDEEQLYMQEAEIFNGRLAMLAITGFVAQEFLTNMAVINETPVFFKPFGDVVAHFLGW